MEPDENVFTESELRVLSRVVSECGAESGNSLSRRTHTEGPWPLLWDAGVPAKPIPRIALRWIENLPVENDAVKAAAKRALERSAVAAYAEPLLRA